MLDVPAASRSRASLRASTVALSEITATTGCATLPSSAAWPATKATPNMISGTMRNRMKLRE